MTDVSLKSNFGLNSSNGSNGKGSSPHSSIVDESLERLNQAREYIKILTGNSETPCTFGCYDDKDKNEETQLKAKHFYGAISEHFKALDKLNKQGYGIFIVIQETSSTKRTIADIGKTRAFYIDSDKTGLPERFHIEPSFIVESSPGKFHTYWVLDELVKISDETFKSYINPLIAHYKADVNCKDLSRVLRPAGFFHNKGEPFLTRIVSNSDRKYSLNEIKIEAPELPLLKLKKESKVKEVTKTIESLLIPETIKLPEDVETVETLVSPQYIAKIHEECSKILKQIETLRKGKRHNTLAKKAFRLGGILSGHKDLSEEYREKLHNLVSSLEQSGKWDKRKESHDCIDSGFKKGAEKPIKLEIEEKLSPSNQCKRLLKIFLSEYGDVEWNSMAMRLEIDREEVEANYIRQRFQEHFNHDVGKETFNDIIVDLAKQNSYNPIFEKLESLPDCNDPDLVLQKLYRLMGIENNPEIQRIQIKKWLIAAVGRIYDPGCKVDNVLILQSKEQGLGKTSFFEALMGKFFQTAGEHKSLADEILAYRQAWCTEYGEIDCVFDKRSVEQMKTFLTKRWDIFRAPYASAPLTYQRNFIFCGTTNQQEFLPDTTGNRRYWVVNINGKIPIREIEAIKDEVWSAAKALYKAGIKGKKADGDIDYVEFLWYFNDSEDELAKINIADSEQIDAWEGEVLNLLAQRGFATVREIQKELELPTSKMTEIRIVNIIKKNNGGIKSRQKMVNGKNDRYWFYADIEKFKEQFKQPVEQPVEAVEPIKVVEAVEPIQEPLEPIETVEKFVIDSAVSQLKENWEDPVSVGRVISNFDENVKKAVFLKMTTSELRNYWHKCVGAFDKFQNLTDEQILGFVNSVNPIQVVSPEDEIALRDF